MKQESVYVHVESANAYFVFYQTVPSSLKLKEICLVYAYGHCYNPLQVLIMYLEQTKRSRHGLNSTCSLFHSYTSYFYEIFVNL